MLVTLKLWDKQNDEKRGIKEWKKYDLWNNLPEEFRLAIAVFSPITIMFHKLAFMCFTQLLAWPKSSSSHSCPPAREVGLTWMLNKSVNGRQAESKVTCVTEDPCCVHITPGFLRELYFLKLWGNCTYACVCRVMPTYVQQYAEKTQPMITKNCKTDSCYSVFQFLKLKLKTNSGH